MYTRAQFHVLQEVTLMETRDRRTCLLSDRLQWLLESFFDPNRKLHTWL
jgi:hypothetical protein